MKERRNVLPVKRFTEKPFGSVSSDSDKNQNGCPHPNGPNEISLTQTAPETSQQHYI